MRTRRVAWFMGVGLALALGASACGGEDEQPGAADPAVADVPADQVPAAVAPDPATAAAEPVSPAQVAAATPTLAATRSQPIVPPAQASALTSRGSLASSNFHPGPPPCSDCPIAPVPLVAVDPVAGAR